MVLPLYLAMTGSEIPRCRELPQNLAWMACQFSPYSQGLTNIPDALPPGSLLTVSDFFPCQGHSPALVAAQLAEALSRLECGGLLLDFQRPPDPEALAMVRIILKDLPCPAAVTELCCAGLDCPVFLSPAPLHQPLAEYLAPWEGREVWLEAALCQEVGEVTGTGCSFFPQYPPEGLAGGFYSDALACNYQISQESGCLRFTLYDTRESLGHKLELAETLGVTRAVGLYQELGKL